jgi:hypothetical protein
VAVAAQLVPRERAGIVARALGALGTLDQGSLPPDVGPGLDDAVRRHYLELGSAWQEVRRLPLTVDSRVTAYFAVPIEASHCVDVFVAPAEDIGPLEVELLDSDGRTLARSRDGSGPRSLTVCAATASTGTLAIRPHVGHGLAAIVVAHAGAEVYRDISARPDVAWVIPRQSLQVAKRALESALETDGYPRAPRDVVRSADARCPRSNPCRSQGAGRRMLAPRCHRRRAARAYRRSLVVRWRVAAGLGRSRVVDCALRLRSRHRSAGARSA